MCTWTCDVDIVVAWVVAGASLPRPGSRSRAGAVWSACGDSVVPSERWPVAAAPPGPRCRGAAPASCGCACAAAGAVPSGPRLAEGSSSHISWCVHCSVWFLYLHRCRSRGPAVQGATGSGRTWQRRLFTNSPLEPPTRYPPHPLNARNLHPRLSLAHRLRFTLSPVQRTRSGWLLPPTSSARARAEELLQANRAASDNSACCNYSASRSHAS